MSPGRPPPKIGPGTGVVRKGSVVAPITPVGLTSDPLGQAEVPGGVQVTSTPAKTFTPPGLKPARAERFVPVKVSLNVVPPTLELPLQDVQSHAKFHVPLEKPSVFGVTAAHVPAPTVGVLTVTPVPPTSMKTFEFPPPANAQPGLRVKVYVIEVAVGLISTTNVPALAPVLHELPQWKSNA